MGYWLRGYEGERNNSFSKSQLPYLFEWAPNLELAPILKAEKVKISKRPASNITFYAEVNRVWKCRYCLYSAVIFNSTLD